MNVLSLFDGMSCGRLALLRAGVKIDHYYASEIKPFAVKFVKDNFPDTIQIGDVTKVSYKYGTNKDENGNEFTDYYLDTENGVIHSGKIDILIGGSPCQDFSTAKAFNNPNKYGLEGDKSRLFYEYLRILKEIKDQHEVYFLLENVKMKKESEKELNQYMGLDSIHLNSKLVSYQLRDRLYWTNIPNVVLPTDREINFQDFKDKDLSRCKEAKLNKTPSREKMWGKGVRAYKFSCYNVTNDTKVHCLTRKQDRCPNSGLIEFEDFCRFLTRRELEGAQTVPYGYTDGLSYANMQDVCGDGWTVDAIAHIFSFLPSSEKDFKEQNDENKAFDILRTTIKNLWEDETKFVRGKNTKGKLNIEKYNTGYLVYEYINDTKVNLKLNYSFEEMVEDVCTRLYPDYVNQIKAEVFPQVTNKLIRKWV